VHTYSATGTLLVTETTGALFPTIDRALRELGRHARAPTTHDSTRYGLSRSSPRTFLAHHRAAISAAIVLADASRQQPFFFLELLGRTRHGDELPTDTILWPLSFVTYGCGFDSLIFVGRDAQNAMSGRVRREFPK
jgi:hypothetical protein